MQPVGNITKRIITIHDLDGDDSRCLGKNRIPAQESDFCRDGETEDLLGKRYQIRVCRRCRRRTQEAGV